MAELFDQGGQIFGEANLPRPNFLRHKGHSRGRHKAG